MNEIPTLEQIREMLPEVKPPVFNYDEYRQLMLEWAEDYEKIRLDVIRILKNFINSMPKAYRNGNPNYLIVKDLLLRGTRKDGMTSSIEYCYKLLIDPYGHDLEVKTDEQTL